MSIERSYVARDRQPFCVRIAKPGDCEVVLDIQRAAMVEGGDYFVRTLEEFDSDRRSARKRLAALTCAEDSLLLVAEVNGEVVGALDLYGGEYDRTRHVVHFGLTVRQDYRGRGIGAAMIETMLLWACEHPCIEKVCITLFTNNTRGIGLCNRFGFRPEGRRHREYLVAPGRYLDSLHLAKWIK